MKNVDSWFLFCCNNVSGGCHEKKYRVSKSLDVKLILILLALCVTSIAAIYSSQQTGQYGGKLCDETRFELHNWGCIVIACCKHRLRSITKLSWPLYIVGFASLILLKILPVSNFTPEKLGAKRWFVFPLVGQIQPSEFFKISLLLVVASIAVKHNAQYMARTFQTDLKLVGKIMLVSLPPMAVVYSQPDTGMVFLYAAAIACILFMSGIQKKLIALCTVIPVTILSTLIFIYVRYEDFFFNKLVTLLKPHQQSRILGWLDPFEHTDQGYQTQQSILAVGSGGMEGKGLAKGMFISLRSIQTLFSLQLPKKVDLS